MSHVQTPARHVRLAVRAQARRLLRDPTDVQAHLARVQASLGLPGSEPVQGALADFFISFGEDAQAFKHDALQMAHGRLAPHVARWFDAQVDAPALSRTNRLATRWSVLARASADQSTRARRCSVDDSRALAERFLRTADSTTLSAQQAFLLHCVTCHDRLAFMLARRALLKGGAALSADWTEVSQQLQGKAV